MDETRKSDEGMAEAELRQPDEAIKDLEPDEQDGEAVKGGVNPIANQTIKLTP
jgi:hypothetical protein